MVHQVSLLVMLVQLVDRMPMPEPPAKRRRGRPAVYTDRLFLKALVIMIIRHLHTVNELLSVLAQPTPEMLLLRNLLGEQGRFPSRRTWERRLAQLPDSLPAQIGCLGRHLVATIQPWAHCGRAAAIDSTVLRSRGGVWHKKHRELGEVPHTSIDVEAHWTKSGWHGWVYGWKLHLAGAVAWLDEQLQGMLWIPLAADLTAANVADNEKAPDLLAELPADVPRPVLIQQKLEGARHDKLVRQMQRATEMPVALAEAGGALQRGHVYILPSDLGLESQAGGLQFQSDAGTLLANLPGADSAVILLSGSDPAAVDIAMAHALRGALVAGQSPDGCFDAVAAEALVARGAQAGTPVQLARMLATRWPSTGKS